MPSFNVWRNNIVYRQAARSIILVLREARSKAITTNHEHRVEIDAVGKMYRITQGNRACNSTKWNIVVRDWASLPAEVLLETNETAIQMNTNGTANGGTIKILDLSAKPKYAVVVQRTGRIRTT
jgi:Tfp pilus assembly protein FimT